MRVDEVLGNANNLLGRQITVEGHLVTDFHSHAYLAPDRSRRRTTHASLGITTDDSLGHILWHRTPVGGALNTIDDFFATSPVFRGRQIEARVFITGTLLRTDDARFPFTLERITQVFAHADTFGGTLVYKPSNTFDRVGFSDLPRTGVSDVMSQRGYYDHVEVRVSGAISGDGRDAYLVDSTCPNGQTDPDKVATMELAVVPDMTGEFPAYTPARSGYQDWEYAQAVAVPDAPLLQHILPDLQNTMTDVQMIGTFKLDGAYPFGARLDAIRTVAVPLGGGVIAIWNIPKLAHALDY